MRDPGRAVILPFRRALARARPALGLEPCTTSTVSTLHELASVDASVLVVLVALVYFTGSSADAGKAAATDARERRAILLRHTVIFVTLIFVTLIFVTPSCTYPGISKSPESRSCTSSFVPGPWRPWSR
jgi:hypothetical protein